MDEEEDGGVGGHIVAAAYGVGRFSCGGGKDGLVACYTCMPVGFN